MATQIVCNVRSCRFCSGDNTKPKNICLHTSIQLQPCSLDADNVVACSEFTEKQEVNNG
jgi:hypothetical protein